MQLTIIGDQRIRRHGAGQRDPLPAWTSTASCSSNAKGIFGSTAIRSSRQPRICN